MTWDYIEKCGLWQLGYTVAELYDMTPRMFYNAQKGLFDHWEMNQQGSWERARWVAAAIINPHVKKSVQPKDLVRFAWEKKRGKIKTKELEKIRAEAKLYKQIMKQMYLLINIPIY